MNDGNEQARELLERLLAGERGDIVLHLAMLVEKSSALDHGDEHYRQILPPNLAELSLDPTTVDEIMAILFEEVSRNPDSDLLFVIASTGADEVTRLAVDLLIHPPRLLTENECAQALGIVGSYLPYNLSKDSQFLPSATQKSLAGALKPLQYSENVSIQGHAGRLLKLFGDLGIETP